jgi:molybdopterin-dependent oxidoreductase alpha subunit
VPRQVSILPPQTKTGLKLTSIKRSAAGLPAVYSTLKHVRDEVGLLDGMRILNRLNKNGGFDCPGCAWPDPKHRSKLGEYCENGAKAIAEEATKKRLTADFFAEHSVEELSTWSDYEIGKAGRLTEPMILRKGSSHYEPISWEAAFAKVANELNALASPNEAVFYTSGRTSNEAAFMYQLFVRSFGTNNLPDCSNMCHESSGVALSETLGIGKGSVTLDDLYEADVILVIGQNPGTNHPRMLSALEKCKKNGGKIISINPLPEAGTETFIDPQNPIELLTGGTQLADHHLQLRINTDIPLFKAIIKELYVRDVESGGKVFDHDFIKEKTTDYDALIEDIKKINTDDMLAYTGLGYSDIEATIELLASKQKIIACWAMGLTQHKNSVDTIKEIVNLLLLKGAIGKKGAGTCPVRGHSNVQGDRTMGIYEKAPEAFLAGIDTEFGIQSPREHGYDVVDSIHAMRDGKVKVFLAMGGNFISATPDSEATGKAMQNCKLTVNISTKLNRSHLVTGEEAMIWPCIARTELDEQKSGRQFVSVENSMGVVSSSEGRWPKASESLLSEPAIVSRLAQATLADSPINWQAMEDNYDVIRDHIEGAIKGFENYNSRVRDIGGFYLPNVARDRTFKLDGKAAFTTIVYEANPLASDEYMMMTIRTHDQYNTTIYGLDDRYRGILGERRVIMMNMGDMQAAGLKEKQKVDLVSNYNGVRRVAKSFYVVPYDIPSRNVATYFPEANVLVPLESVALKSNTPASKSVKIKIEDFN